ncbi:MAG: SLC13 family permease [Bacteroidales bacterium]|nr:SLC13 family permease [Bacteroidales bacterium]
MLTFDGILVLAVIAFIIISLYVEIVGPAFTFLIGVIVLGFFGVLTPSEILQGFSNEQILVIIMLLLLGDIFRRTAVIDALFDRVFRKTKSYKGFMARMMALVAPFSAFLNNTPLVAIMMPYVHRWSKNNGIKPSKLLIPLSYAAILGGCTTLIGTSTNLIVNGLVVDQQILPEMEPLGLFEFAWVGVPMMIIGFVYLMLFSNKLLPEKEDVVSDFAEKTREYLVEVKVNEGSPLCNKTIEDARLRNLEGLFLVEIQRREEQITAVSPNEVIKNGDILVFAGNTETVADMVNSNNGMVPTQVGMFTRKNHTEVREAVISHNSSLINKTVREAYFRGRYDAAIIAIHRNGERISGKIGNVKLKAGDVLLLLTGDDFNDRAAETKDFYLISKVRDFRKPKLYESLLLIGGTISAITLSGLGFTSLFLALAVLLMVILLFKIASPKDLPKSIDYNLALIIAMALALGTAMTKTGVAEYIARFVISVFKPFGDIGLLAGIYLITAILGAYITNKASAALVFPISLTMAVDLGYDPVPFVLVVAFASAANFITPIGYQTNLMVYGPGGYSFKDFARIGTPLTIIYMVVTIFMLWAVYLV